MRVRTLSALLLVSALGWGLAAARPVGEAGKKGEGGGLVVVDSAGKEVKLSTWKFLHGTRRLAWLAPAPKKAKPAKGDEGPVEAESSAVPEALELREENSTTFEDGILTLLPVSSLKKIVYDGEDKTVKVTYLFTSAKEGEEGSATGTTKYTRQGINKLTIEGEVDLGELGKAARKFQGGSAKGVRSIQFSAPKATAPPAGRPAVVIANDKEKTPHKVTDLQALYSVGRGREELSGTLLFRTTVKVPLAKLQTLRHVESEERGQRYDFEVTLKDGKQHTLTLLMKTSPEDGKAASLEGLLGRVPGGYKLFPMHTIREVQFDQAEPRPEKKRLDARR
jgi:hypothetical protein